MACIVLPAVLSAGAGGRPSPEPSLVAP